ncbi:TetR/AcrR family transcriptional regulator [Aeromicrobium wangtongii]|uniref:TetR/AcrR family transcriptional regulator n=1 Tax=Aeromicrobium wangtongii TaxID=2969247 RepID=UPI002017FEBC|nr:TetR/AcrR family transcriptional regulator [Aeromicrobium wangtongii]MCL3820318.1 TetR/AcrR family transcriptional regulator [Aeromicrobium wangtongii]
MSVIDLLPVRERILAAATEHYYAEGIRAVSADKLIAAAHVSKVTFYRHFPTKGDLVAAYLSARSEEEKSFIVAKRDELAGDPAGVLRWYAGAVGELSCSPGFRGCPFINAAAELPDGDHPGRRVIAEHRAWVVQQAAELLAELGVDDPATKAEQLMMLRDGAMVSGYVGRAPEQIATALVAAGRAIIGR